MSRKQSLNDRTNRLKMGCCPIHGLFMSQVDGWYYPDDRVAYTIVGCPRRDCDPRAMADSYEGPWELTPECSYLLAEELPTWLQTGHGQRVTKPRVRRATRSEVWAKTGGRCYYCGIGLDPSTNASIDHLIPRSEGGLHSLDNVVPACRRCNSAKGTKSLEDFRFHRAMQEFQRRNGVAFTRSQVEYLESIGVDLEIPAHIFWFELQEDKSLIKT